MYVCMYVCMYVQYVCMYVFMYVCMYVCIIMYVCKYVCMYVKVVIMESNLFVRLNGHLSYKCPKNTLGDRDQPERKKCKRKHKEDNRYVQMNIYHHIAIYLCCKPDIISLLRRRNNDHFS